MYECIFSFKILEQKQKKKKKNGTSDLKFMILLVHK